MENIKRKNAEDQEEKTMTNINAQNKENNLKGSRKAAPMIIAAIAALAGAAVMLTGCGTDVPASSLSANDAAVTTSVSATATMTTALTTAKAENNTTGTSTVKDTNAEEKAGENTAASNAHADNIGVDEATAIANVRAQVGSGAQIISSTKGNAPDTGFACWVVVVAPVTNGTTPETVTYYSGYQFCYPFGNDAAGNAASGDGQNPVMNFIGTYSNGRAVMTVSCIGKDQAAIHISWGGSAFETSVWDMSGKVDCSSEGLAVLYDNCTKQTFRYTEDGQLISDDIEYTNGSGSVEFLSSDNCAYWHDDNGSAGANPVFSFFNE